MAKKIFIFLLLSICALAQSSRSGGSFLASSYANWQLVTTSAVPVAGTFPVSLSAGSATTADGRQFLPLRAGFPVLVDNGANQEIVTPATTANCSLRPNPYAPCTITATFTKAHPVGTLIRTSSFGLQEAIADTISNGGGVVMVDSTWRGATANITGAIGTTAAAIQDNRSGTPSTYAWNGSAYAVTVSVSGCSSSNGNITCPANINAPTGDVVALNQVATQPTDSITFFGNPLLDPTCNIFNWFDSGNNPLPYFQFCFDTQNGLLSSMVGGANKGYYIPSPLQLSAHNFIGNNTNSPQTQSPSLIGTADITPNWYIAGVSGGANSPAGCTTPPVTSLSFSTNYLTISFIASFTNNASATFNLCGLGALTIYKNAQGSTGNPTTLAANDLVGGSLYTLQYNNVVAGGVVAGWMLLNPSVITAGASGLINISQGTITSNSPAITATATLNNGATAFVGDSRTWTCTAAAANSALFQYFVGANDLFTGYFNGTNCTQFRLDITNNTNTGFRVDVFGNHLGLSNSMGLQWGTTSSLGASPTYDSGFARFGAKTVNLCTNAGCSDSAGLLLAGNTCRVTADITLATTTTVICSWSLPAVAQAWAWQCTIPWAVTAGTTPTLAIQVNPSQTPTGTTNASAEIKTTNTNTATEATVALSASGTTTVLTSPTLTTSATVFLSSTSGTVLASATAGTFAIQMIGTGTGFAGAAKAGATCTLN